MNYRDPRRLDAVPIPHCVPVGDNPPVPIVNDTYVYQGRTSQGDGSYDVTVSNASQGSVVRSFDAQGNLLDATHYQELPNGTVSIDDWGDEAKFSPDLIQLINAWQAIIDWVNQTIDDAQFMDKIANYAAGKLIFRAWQKGLTGDSAF